jgi:hypothetical protein
MGPDVLTPGAEPSGFAGLKRFLTVAALSNAPAEPLRVPRA